MFGEPVLAAILQPGGARRADMILFFMRVFELQTLCRDGLRFSLPSDVAGLRAAVHDAEEL